jgi:hypothetical protein
VTHKILILIGIIAASVGFISLFTRPHPPLPIPNAIWVIEARQPLAIGGYGDNFCYAGEGVQELNGFLSLSIGPDNIGSIYASVSTTQGPNSIQASATDKLAGKIEIITKTKDLTEVKQEVQINREPGNENVDLPPTYALLSGQAIFDLYLQGQLLYENLIGKWSVANALRRPDGSIRQSGLVYSPLLRDKSGFSDPSRIEFTLLLHSDEPDENNRPNYSVALHLVFSEVTIDRQPPPSSD